MPEASTTVWCASFPKSGNTWIRALFAGIMGDGSVRLSSLAGHSAGNDQRAIFREFGITPSVLDDQQANDLMAEVGASVAVRSDKPVFRKTHNAFGGTGAAGSRHLLATPTRALYIVRDPRAVVVSMAHHMGFSQQEAVTVMANGPFAGREDRQAPDAPEGAVGDRYVTRGCQVAFDWGSWSRNVTSWLDQTEVPVKLIRYEDLISDTNGQVAQIVEWLELDIPADRVRQAVQESSFESLSAQELVGGFVEATSPDRQFFRRGQANSWSAELEPGLAEQVIADHATTMTRLGYLP